LWTSYININKERNKVLEGSNERVLKNLSKRVGYPTLRNLNIKILSIRYIKLTKKKLEAETSAL
jgi:hypothetical protein